MSDLARYVMVGGFLGAGKTTALLRLAEMLKGLGKRVGLITNDQSTGLVDTTLARSRGVATEEITGGCFCCRFDSLTAAAQKLAAEERPNVFLAEPVGSCTDLAATVAYPLRRMYGDQFTIAPYSVLVDPVRAERILELEAGKAFSPKVIYIYEKQLEEADIVVVNKCDTLPKERRERLMDAIRSRFPKAKVMAVSARSGEGFAEWLEALIACDLGRGAAMGVDYDTYAEGEALLGWTNATIDLDSDAEFDGNDYLMRFARTLRAALAANGAEVAHLKMTLTPDSGPDLGVVNLTRTDAEPEFAHRLAEPLSHGELTVNLRAEAAPELLQSLLEAACRAAPGVTATTRHVEAFRPGRPVPTHRLTTA